jgi:2-polyprenyl-3-methyl-5-hydroxy-6-metoxy-1,4-benzoquinol methylase
MLKINNCPVCGNSKFVPFITCKDYTVSSERFNIVSCETCNFKFTNPRPEDSKLEAYYKSEEYISHSDTKKGIIAKLYHAVRNHTLQGKLKLISKYVSRGTALDYGCGTGMFLKVCKDNGWEVFGMEPDEGARAIGIKQGLAVDADKQSLHSKIRNKQLDIITLWHVLEHVTDLDLTLTFFNLKLKDTGRLIIAVPNYTSYDAKHYGEFWAAYDVPRHLYHFEVNTISKLLSKFGFKLEECLPMKFDSYYVSMLSEKYKTGSVNYFKAFISGFKSNSKANSPKDYSSVIYVFKKA